MKRVLLVVCAVAAGVFAGCNRNLDLPPQPQFGSLGGALDTDDKVPASNNTVRLINSATGVRADQQTDADGGFFFGGLPPGSYLVQADVDGFAPLREGPFNVPSGNAIDVGVLKLLWLGQTAAEGSISGSVIVSGGASGGLDGGADGGLLPDGGSDRPSDAMGATVSMLLERTGGQPPAKVAETTVDAFGRFSARVPPGRYTVEATHPWYVSAQRRDVLLGEGQLLDLGQPLVLELNPADVSGEVVLEVETLTGSSTRTAAGVTVTSDTGRVATTDAQGRYTLPGLAAGTRRLSFSFPGFHDANTARTISLSAGESATYPQVKLLLDRGDLAGRVRMSDGSQLENVNVFIAGAADGGIGAYTTQAVRSTTEPSVGDFVLRGLPVATYNVVAQRTNYVDATSPAVTVRVDQVTRLTDDLRLARLQGDFLIEDPDATNTPGFTRDRVVTLVLSNVTNAAEFRVVEGSAQALTTQAWQPYATNRIPFTLSAGDGAKTVYLQIKNTMGNEGAPLSATTVLDTTPPGTLSLELASGQGFTRIPNPLPVTLSALDTGGVAFVRLAAVESDGGIAYEDAGVALPDGGFPALLAPRLAYVRDTSFQRPTSADGVQGVVAQFIDNAGNASDVVQASIVIDTVAPTGSVTITRGARATVDGYTNSLLVDLAQSWGMEPNGGFVQVRLANDAMNLANAVAQPTAARASWFLDAQGEGTKTVHYLFVDAAGNQSGVGQATIIYDATLPFVTATRTSPSPTSNPVVAVSLSTIETSPFSPDAGLAISESPLFTNATLGAYTTSFTHPLSPGDGPRSVFVRVRDAAGNEGSTSVSLELDTTAPTGLGLSLVGALRDGTPSTALTATTSVTVNLTQSGATQVLLGDENLTTCPAVGATWRPITGTSIANHTLTGSTATRTVSACFADAAGNVAGPVSTTIQYDGTGPTGCALALTGLRADGANSGSARTALRSVPFTLNNCMETPTEVVLTEQTSVNCSSSSLLWTPYSTVANQLTLSSVDGLKRVNGCVRDAARNTTTLAEVQMTLDTTPPTGPVVTLNGGQPYVNAAAVDGGVAFVSVRGTATGAAEWAFAEEGTSPSTFVSYTTANPAQLALSTGDGVKTVKALFRDDLGNTTPVEVSDSVEVDTTPPTLTALALLGALADGSPSSTLTASNTVTASFTQTGASTYYVGDASLVSCPTTGHAALVGNTASITLGGTTTTRTVKACVGDAAGNLSALRTATIDVDTSAPSGCSLVITGLRADTALPTSGAGAGMTGRRDVRITLNGCTEVPTQIALSQSAVTCTQSANLVWAVYDTSATNTYTLTGIDGPITLAGCARDAARNITSLTNTPSITLDTTPPSGASVVLDNGAAYVNAAQKAQRMNLNRASALGTVTGAYEWALAEGAVPSTWRTLAGNNPFTFDFSANDGVKTVRALFRDEVGNVTASEVSDSIEFDTAPPTLTSVLITGALADGTVSTATTADLNVTATVIHSGGTRIAFGSSAPLNCTTATYAPFSGTTVATTLGGSGSPRTLAVCVTDEAGNPAAASVSDTIAYDPTSPGGCTLTFRGRKADGSLAAVTPDATALRDVTYTLTNCAEPVVEVALVEAATVTCSVTANLDWKPLTGTDTFTLSPVDGLKTVLGCVRDATGNVQAAPISDTITLDTTPPSVASVSIKGGAAYFNRADYTAAGNTMTMSVSGAATDAVDWAIAESATPSTFTALTSQSFVFSTGEGVKTISALFRDALGNVTPVAVTDTIVVDTVLPSLTAINVSGTLADGTASDTNTSTTSVQLSLTHIDAVGLLVGDGSLASCPTTGYASFGGGTSATITLPGTGASRTVRACVSDVAGNVAGFVQDSITYDAAGPSGCALTLVGRRVDGTATSGPTADKTALTQVGVNLTGCSDAPADVYLVEATSAGCSATATLTWQPYTAGVTNFTLSGNDGLKTVVGCVRDATRNVVALVAPNETITLDTTPPTAASVSLHGGQAYFNRAAYLAATPASTNTMTLTATATGASELAWAESAAPTVFAAATFPSNAPVTLSAGDGEKLVRALFRDDVGNVTTAEVNDTIEVDTSAPTLTAITVTGALADGVPSTSSTSTTSVTVGFTQTGATLAAMGNSTFTCPASLAGFSSFNGTSATTTLTDSSATRTVRACVADAAGNVSSTSSASILYDATSPSGCVLTLVGRRTDGSSTAGSVPEKTALTGITATVSSCSETVTDIYLFESGSAVTCPAPGSASWLSLSGATSIATTLSTTDALKTMQACVRDATRNVSAASFQDTITLDTTAPTGTSVSLHAGAAYFNRAAYVAAANLNRMNVTGVASGATEWAWAESAAPTTFSSFASSPTSVLSTLSSGDGTKTVRALFRDDVGNTSLEVSDTIEVDTGVPTLSSLTVTGALADGTASTTTTATTTVSVSLSQVGGTLLAIGDSSFSCPATLAGFSAFNGTSTTTTLTDSSAVRTVRACVADAAGNISGMMAGSILYDATLPSGCVLTLVGRRTDGSSTAGTVPEKTALTGVTASLSGCSETPTDVYLIESTGVVACPAAGSAAWQTLSGGLTIGTSLSAGDALKTVKACVRDAARNVSAASFQDTITLDTTPPTATSVSLHAGADYFNRAAYLAAGSINRMNITGTATGATEWAWAESATPTTFGSFSSPAVVANTFSSGDGTKKVSALFRDDVGNTTTTEAQDTIEVDTVVPTLTSLTLVGTLGDGTSSAVISNTTSVTAQVVQSGGVSFASGDSAFTCPNGTSFTSFNGSSASVTLPGSGSPRTVRVCVADAAGNASSVVSDTIEFDGAAPSGCSLVLTGRRVDGVATSGPLLDLTALRDVGISLSGCADTNVEVALTESGSITCSNTAGLTWTTLSGTSTFQVSAGDASKTVRGCVRDAALNVGSLTADSITLDTTPPDNATVSISGSGGYANSFLRVVSGSADDAVEWAVSQASTGPFTYGAYSTTPSTANVTFASPDGKKFIYARFRDALLNATATVSSSITIDTTPPTAPVLLTVDSQNRGARLFWDPSTDATAGIAAYELLADPTGTPTTVRTTTAGTATSGYVLALENRTDQVFAVRAVDNAGNRSGLSALRGTTVGWKRTTVSPGSVYPIRPLDIALRGSDVFVTYMETDSNWSGLAGNLRMAVSHDRGETWSFKTLDGSFAGQRSLAPIAFNDNGIWVASVGNPGYSSDIIAGRVSIHVSTDNGDTWTNVSDSDLSTSANYGKVDSLGLLASGSSMRLFYLSANSSATKQVNVVYSSNATSTFWSSTPYMTSGYFGSAPYQVTNGLKSCAGNFSSVTLWRDRGSSTTNAANLLATTHYFLPSLQYVSSDGYQQWVTYGVGTGQEVGNYDLACTSLPETMQAYVVFDRAPAAAWAVGVGGTVLKYDDTAWVTAPSPTPRDINSVQDVWAVGTGYTAGGTAYSLILKWNGTVWEEIQATVGNGYSLNDTYTNTASNVFAVGNGGTILRWNGSAWSAMTSGVANNLYGVWGSSSSNVIAVGSSGVIRQYNGTSWAGMTSPTGNILRAVWGTAANNVWAVGDNGTIIRYNGTSWSTVTSPVGAGITLNSLWGSTASDIWAVGSSGTILRYNGTSWSTFSSPTGQALNEVSGVSANDVWAVGLGGTAIRFNGTSWSVQPTETTSTLNSVWWGGSSGGPASTLYGTRKLGSQISFSSPVALRTDVDRNIPPQVWAGGRSVYVLYRTTGDQLMLGESANEGSTYSNWTTLESGANKGLWGVLSGDNSTDVAVAFTDVNASTMTVMIPSVAAFPLTPLAGAPTSTLTWATVPQVDRYQIDADPDGVSPWANVDFTSTTQATVPAPPGLAPYLQVRAVDEQNMPGNTGEMWQLRPFSDSTLYTIATPVVYPSNTGGIVAYNDRALLMPPRGIWNAATVWRTTNYGSTWTQYAMPGASLNLSGPRAVAGFNGRAAVFHSDGTTPTTLQAQLFSELGAGASTQQTLATGVNINLLSAKASVDNNGLVVAYADTSADLIRVQTANSSMAFTVRPSIATTAANTIDSLEVAKVDFSTGRIVITWREYSAGDPRNDYIYAVESTNTGASWGTPYVLRSGTSSSTSNSASYDIGSTDLSGSNNGAYSVLARTTEFNDFWKTPANLYLTVTGTDHSTSVSSATYVDIKLDSETVDKWAFDAYGNSDGHYLVWRAESLDGTVSKLRFAYCFADCHLFSSWDRSLMKVWTSYVKDQGRFVGMTVGQVSNASLYDPAIYIMYTESTGSSRRINVMSRGVHRRAR